MNYRTVCEIHGQLNCPDAACRRTLLVKRILDHAVMAQGQIADYDADKWSEDFKDRAVQLIDELRALCEVDLGKRNR